ncbi:LysE family translocator [Colwellia sp. D2M02]|uniref:LysE family translocator n=1 Tax=Colwellia asteriadis TaxID=517723 RepID=A0ABN1LAL6_9GAMM|nr:LysE family translocator [Colwellia sp. D2M02]MBU2892780.1 LysE family translocator [Colwellia sp. D2M02]
MLDTTLLLLFIPTFFLVSITPGMCMTLAMTLGMSIGIRKTLWMMYGELLGVALVAIAAVIGVSAVMLEYPKIFSILKLIGASYLLYVGINMWRSRGKLALNKVNNEQQATKRLPLFNQGFITAIANPKGWAFMVSLLPPFINPQLTLAPQLAMLLAVIILSEFICMMIYATGGKTIGKVLTKGDNVKLMNKISGTLMVLVAVWLALS